VRHRSRIHGFVFLFLLTAAAPLPAQLEPPSTGGIVELDRELRMLGHEKRVLMIGAHPDDEDTELLTLLVRGRGAEAAYLSLNRGEGGQNLIGPELGMALGLLRTEELLAARRLDGARQYFTRAYDFGYSKSLDETWRHWPRDTILKDVVRIVRRFRPQIVVSVFSGTPRDGHGQHQAAGWAAREAFRAAGDSSRFPELAREEGLAPWTPLKLYRSTRFDSLATTLTLEGGELDRAAGRSFHQIAMAGRSLHRSQDMGRLQQLGASRVPLALLEDRTGKGGGGLFSGIDTAGRAPGDIPRAADADPAALLSLRARWAAAGVAAEQLAHLDRAITTAAGVVCDARGDDDRVAPGQRITVTLECWNTGSAAHTVVASVRAAPAMAVDGRGAATLRLARGGRGSG
jgi:LmbE family N-acetylglucosaminyl deacetylase